MSNIIRLFLFIFLIITSSYSQDFKKANLSVNNINITVELALNNKQRRKGLMHRDKLAEGEGMLFVFKKNRKASFWMKNTIIPLSVAFINEAGKIVSIKQMKPLSLKAVNSEGICRYALEVPQGWFKDNNIKKNDLVEIPAYLLNEVR